MSASGGAAAAAAAATEQQNTFHNAASLLGTLEDFEELIAPVKEDLSEDILRVAKLVWCVVVRGCTCPPPKTASDRLKKCSCVRCSAVTKDEWIPAGTNSTRHGFSLYGFLRQFSSVVDRVCINEEGFWRVAQKFVPVFGRSWEQVKARETKTVRWDDPKFPGREQRTAKIRALRNVRLLRPDDRVKDRCVLKARLALLVRRDS